MVYLKYKPLIYILLSVPVMIIASFCSRQDGRDSTNSPQKGTFGYDLDFLSAFDPELVILGGKKNSSRVIVSAKYQGKVFTSTARGNKGSSYGWINYSAFEGPEDEHMNAYGGENRLWLGPEGGKYSLFFKPGSEMVFENWFTPSSMDTESWNILRKSENAVSLKKTASITNYQGTVLDMTIKRNIRILARDKISQFAGKDLSEPGVDAVAYHTQNTITNTGSSEWNEVTGVPCIWILDMFSPSSSSVVVIPYNDSEELNIATTDYFGEIPEDRIRFESGYLFFKADGNSRGKLGLSPGRATPLAASYDVENKILTITEFDIKRNGLYLNQEWRLDTNPLAGDAVNAYNDGPLEDGSQMGPFYEIESVSPAAFLAPGESLTHQHTVYHFEGSEEGLNVISKNVLGIDLNTISHAL